MTPQPEDYGPENGPMNVPPNVLAASPVVGLYERQSLPLNLLALIISFVDDHASLANLTRTSRLLYYMTLPKLWESVTLRSYAELRYVDGRPEGFGGGSPYATGLASLVAGNNSAYVKSLRLTGEYRECDVDEYSKGRVPNNAMMMNIALRAAIDRLSRLETFKWELNVKMSQFVYQSLAMRPALRSLTLKFPSARTPRPTALIPPMPHLRELFCLNIDPLAYPDDISFLLAGSRSLERLTLHWNPGIRKNAEQSINLNSYFHRCMSSGLPLRIKHFGLYNLYAAHAELDRAFDPNYIESIYLMNISGGDDADTIFLDETWKRNMPKGVPSRLKIIRTDDLRRDQVESFRKVAHLQEIYLFSSSKRPSPTYSETVPSPLSNNLLSQTQTRATTPTTPFTDVATPQSQKLERGECVSLASDYLAVFQHHHGSSLRCILFPDDWHLDSHVVKKFLISCPNIQQLGVALKDSFPSSFRIFFPYGRNVFALRILNKFDQETIDRMLLIDERLPAFMLGHDLSYPEFDNLRYIQLGNLVIFEAGPIVHHPAKGGSAIRLLKRISASSLKHLGLWAMATREVI